MSTRLAAYQPSASLVDESLGPVPNSFDNGSHKTMIDAWNFVNLLVDDLRTAIDVPRQSKDGKRRDNRSKNKIRKRIGPFIIICLRFLVKCAQLEIESAHNKKENDQIWIDMIVRLGRYHIAVGTDINLMIVFANTSQWSELDVIKTALHPFRWYGPMQYLYLAESHAEELEKDLQTRWSARTYVDLEERIAQWARMATCWYFIRTWAVTAADSEVTDDVRRHFKQEAQNGHGRATEQVAALEALLEALAVETQG
ncbi:hypothetical protein UCRPC4_g04518 [Phaeomoniella chlamydospora]|uniref:Uncharacterized protein n=1 Tax=Phaeomoniella chlamydospora TaxID=158046 RepID=A0A0G2G6L4_PHACM|nr:hypothetical protein UCRPC4_g04518 [Phaeomoniella chlamydospora]